MASSYDYHTDGGSSPYYYYAKPPAAMSAYRFFFHDCRGQVQEAHWHATGQRIDFLTLSNRLSELWEHADAVTASHYRQLEIKDQRRFLLEYMVWQDRCQELAKPP